MQNEWGIKNRSKTCFVTGKAFQKGDYFYTLLYRESEEFRREDLCEEAWLAKRDSDIRPFSFWRSRYDPPAPVQPDLLPQKDGESIFRRLITKNNPADANVIYVLALLLERKRLLRAIEGQDSDMLVYEHVQTGEIFLIRNPYLNLDQIPDVQREVSELLAQNLES